MDTKDNNREKTPGYAYHPVLGGFDIAKRVADYLEDYYPKEYNGTNRAQTVRWVNDILHGRGPMNITGLIDKLAGVQTADGQARLYDIRIRIKFFQSQQALISAAYDGPQGVMKHIVRDDVGGRSRKIITQSVYDKAVTNGFPADFFADSYFNDVHFYCLPEHSNFDRSLLTDSKFNVCALRNANFCDATLYSCNFQTVDLRGSYFEGCTLAHTHFNDVDMSKAYFHQSTLRHGNITDCNMNLAGFSRCQFDEVHFGRITLDHLHAWSEVYVGFGAVGDETKAHLRAGMAKELNLHESSIIPPKRRPPKPPPERGR